MAMASRLLSFLLILLILTFASCSRLLASSVASCPIDFSYLSQFRPTNCQSASTNSSSPCCSTLFNTFGIGIALYLRSSGFFALPDNASVTACFDSFRSALPSVGVANDASTNCKLFESASTFVRSPLLCSGILTADDWRQKVGITSMDSSCAGDLSNAAVCQACNTDAASAIAKASSLSGNNSNCLYFGVLYGAGVVNEFGPTNTGTASCLLASIAPSKSTSKHPGVYIGVGAGLVIILGCIVAIVIWLWCLRRRQLYHNSFVRRNKLLLGGTVDPNVGAMWYKFEDIKAATNSFAQGNLIGAGGFASVYKGVMPNGSLVAVKRIKNCSPEGDAEFANEVEVINAVRHRSLVVLRGCCVASTENLGHMRLLVYDYMINGCLEEYLFSGKKPLLEWPERMKIVLGAAKGIAYLHNGVEPAIIHRDIKANNILLDEDLNARVADFGLARITEEGMTHMTTRVAGTQGYMAPEYALYGQLTEKSDVYSFGVLLLVTISGRPALDLSPDVRRDYPLITDWAWVMVKKGRTIEVVDERVRDNGSAELMQRFVLVGILCAHLLVACRPTMAQAVNMLQGDADIPSIPDRPLPLTQESFEAVDHAYSFSSKTSAAEMDPEYFTAEDLLR